MENRNRTKTPIRKDDAVATDRKLEAEASRWHAEWVSKWWEEITTMCAIKYNHHTYQLCPFLNRLRTRLPCLDHLRLGPLVVWTGCREWGHSWNTHVYSRFRFLWGGTARQSSLWNCQGMKHTHKYRLSFGVLVTRSNQYNDLPVRPLSSPSPYALTMAGSPTSAPTRIRNGLPGIGVFLK